MTPEVEASISTMENTGRDATPSGVCTKEDIVSVTGVGDRDIVYLINRKEVTK